MSSFFFSLPHFDRRYAAVRMLYGSGGFRGWVKRAFGIQQVIHTKQRTKKEAAPH